MPTIESQASFPCRAQYIIQSTAKAIAPGRCEIVSECITFKNNDAAGEIDRAVKDRSGVLRETGKTKKSEDMTAAAAKAAGSHADHGKACS